MKAILIAVAVVLAINSFSQDSTNTKQFYLDKSHNQKITGFVLLGGGAVLSVIGMIEVAQDLSLFYDDGGNQAEVGGILATVGVAAMLVSIPFFISSGMNARKAALVVGTQTLPQPIPNTIAVRRQVSVGLRIAL